MSEFVKNSKLTIDKSKNIEILFVSVIQILSSFIVCKINTNITDATIQVQAVSCLKV